MSKKNKEIFGLKKKFFYIICMIFLCFVSFQAFSQEICNNGIDDDGDGLIDLNDTVDCACKLVTSEYESFIPNPSFEETYGCPMGPISYQEYSAFSYLNNWEQASAATTDYYNSCDHYACEIYSNLPPFPDGNGVCGFIISKTKSYVYNEYLGSYLNQKLVTNSTYSINFSLLFVAMLNVGMLYTQNPNLPPIDLTFFGSSDTNGYDLPFVGQGEYQTGCPLGYGKWIELAHITINPNDIYRTWKEYTITFTPSVDITAVAIGGPCNVPNTYYLNDSVLVQDTWTSILPYFFIDNLILNFAAPIHLVHKNNCENIIKITNTSAYNSFQWYYNNIALVGQTGPSLDIEALNLPETGEYQVVGYRQDGCAKAEITVSSSIHKPSNTYISDTICDNKYYNKNGFNVNIAGKHVNILHSQWGCDSTIYLNLTVLPTKHSSLTAEVCQRSSYNLYGFNIENITQNSNYQLIMKSQNACDSIIDLTLNVAPNPSVKIKYTPYDLCDNEYPVLTANTTQQNIVWSTGEVTDKIIVNNYGYYMVSVSDGVNCVHAVDSIKISPCGHDIFIPNCISPNGDGINDTWIIDKIELFQNFSVSVFNRWGQELYRKTEKDYQPWDGKYKNKDLPIGTYLYYIVLNGKYKYANTITIIK